MLIIISLLFTFYISSIVSENGVELEKPPLDITKQFGVTRQIYNVLGKFYSFTQIFIIN